MASGQTGTFRELTPEEKAAVKGKLVIANRELQEIRFAMDYEAQYRHGTDGHNRLMLLAKMARHLGFSRGNSDIPDPVIVNDELAMLVQWSG